MSNFFDDLMESVQQMDEIHRGERQPSREFTVDPLQVKAIRQAIRQATGLSQAKFARLIDVQVAPPHDFVDVESCFKSFKEL
jgi:putative transcriptional regulator